MKVYPLDALDDASMLLWSGNLFVGSVDARGATAWLAAISDGS
jgi:hypothetical protein